MCYLIQLLPASQNRRNSFTTLCSTPTPDAVSVSIHFRGPLRLLPRCVSTCTVLSMLHPTTHAELHDGAERPSHRRWVELVHPCCICGNSRTTSSLFPFLNAFKHFENSWDIDRFSCANSASSATTTYVRHWKYLLYYTTTLPLPPTLFVTFIERFEAFFLKLFPSKVMSKTHWKRPFYLAFYSNARRAPLWV